MHGGRDAESDARSRHSTPESSSTHPLTRPPVRSTCRDTRPFGCPCIRIHSPLSPLVRSPTRSTHPLHSPTPLIQIHSPVSCPRPSLDDQRQCNRHSQTPRRPDNVVDVHPSDGETRAQLPQRSSRHWKRAKEEADEEEEEAETEETETETAAALSPAASPVRDHDVVIWLARLPHPCGVGATSSGRSCGTYGSCARGPCIGAYISALAPHERSGCCTTRSRENSVAGCCPLLAMDTTAAAVYVHRSNADGDTAMLP